MFNLLWPFIIFTGKIALIILVIVVVVEGFGQVMKNRGYKGIKYSRGIFGGKRKI